MLKQLDKYENLHILLWLVKDTCWVMDWHTGGIFMIAPTVLVALHIAWLSRDNKADLFHNTAVCFWIFANTTWMAGEFYYNDSWRPAAATFFILGLIVLAIYYLFILPTARREELNDANNKMQNDANP